MCFLCLRNEVILRAVNRDGNRSQEKYSFYDIDIIRVHAPEQHAVIENVIGKHTNDRGADPGCGAAGHGDAAEAQCKQNIGFQIQARIAGDGKAFQSPRV